MGFSLEWKLLLLRGEIAALDHYCPLEGKTKGTRSTPYYSIERIIFINLLYYNYSNSLVKSHTKSKGKR